MIPWWSTDFGEPEKKAVCAAIDAKCISQGRVTRQFEERLAATLGVPYVACTTSGTTALTMALLACGVGPGDEVIVPNRTWIATAHAVMMTGAKVVLADVMAIAPFLATVNTTRHTKAVIPVYLNGRNCPIHEGTEAALKKAGISVVADACQMFPNAVPGDIACYSLSTAKIIATGQGGFCATRDEGLYKELKALRTHDVEDAMVPQVLTWKRFGYNFRFTDIQAAIGIAQLDRLQERIDRLNEIHAIYAESLPIEKADGVPLYAELRHQEPERLRAHLLEHGIEARPFYPSLHTAPYLNAKGEFPNSEKWSRGLILPSGPCQRLPDIRRVCDVIHDFR